MSEFDPRQDPNPFAPELLVDRTEQSLPRPQRRRKTPVWLGIVSILIVIGLPATAVILMTFGIFGVFN